MVIVTIQALYPNQDIETWRMESRHDAGLLCLRLLTDPEPRPTMLKVQYVEEPAIEATCVSV